MMAGRASRPVGHPPGQPAPSRPHPRPIPAYARRVRWSLPSLLPYVCDWRVVSALCIAGIVLIAFVEG
jgi:hypothetical protein